MLNQNVCSKSGEVVSNNIRIYQGASNQNSIPKNQNRCSKLEGDPAQTKKLQSVNLSKVKSVFWEEVQTQNREFQNSI